MRYIGTSYGDAKTPSRYRRWIQYDAMVSYELGELSSSLKGAKAQFNINNIADTKYVASCAGDSACFYGGSYGYDDGKLRTVERQNASAGFDGRASVGAIVILFTVGTRRLMKGAGENAVNVC